MTEQKPTETAQQVIQALREPFTQLLEVFERMEIGQNSLAHRQLRHKKDFQAELAPLKAQLDDIAARIGYIERLAHEYDWERRREGSK